MATSMKLDEQLKRKVQLLADQRQRSPRWIMREAIRDYVSREETKERLKKEALASWTAYQETGRHLKGEEAREWLITWGKDDEGEVPPSHG